MKNKEKYFDKIVENFTSADTYENCKFRKKYLFKQPIRVCKDDECATCNERLREWLEKEYNSIEHIDWENIPVNTPLKIKDCNEEFIRHFAYFDKETKRVYCWDDGCASITTNTSTDWADVEIYLDEDKRKYEK